MSTSADDDECKDNDVGKRGQTHPGPQQMAKYAPIFVPPPNRGAFIVIEGIDASGKTTLANDIFSELSKDGNVEVLRFPSRHTKIGLLLDSVLKGGAHLPSTSLHMLFAANRREYEIGIRTSLAIGKTVICDRYAYSGSVYTIATSECDIEWCKSADRGLPAPDVVLYLDVLPEDTEKRRQDYGDEVFEKRAVQERVYLAYADHFVKRSNESSTHWYSIDAKQSYNDVRTRALAIVRGWVLFAANMPAADFPLGTLFVDAQ